MRQTIQLLAVTTTLMFSQVAANTRTVEVPFALSADRNSEFSSRFPALSPGRIVVEANWKSSSAGAPAIPLTLILIRPDGTEASRKVGSSVLRTDYQASAPEIESFIKARNFKWTAKLINGPNQNHDVTGRIRITVSAAPTTLEDTQFTLIGLGNAQEIAFIPPAPGRIVAEVSWRADSIADGSSPSSSVTVSLIHPAQSRTHARRLGMSPIRVEHQVTERELDQGSRWLVRLQNDGQVKVSGRLRVFYTPGL